MNGKLFTITGALMVLALLGIGFLRVDSEALAFTCASCTQADENNCAAFGAWIVWCASPPAANISTTADSNGRFSVYTEVKWCDSSIGTHGAFELGSDLPTNIENVTNQAWNPAYFFPQNHCEVLGVTISGDLQDPSESGFLNNRVWKWSPFRYDEIGLDIAPNS